MSAAEHGAPERGGPDWRAADRRLLIGRSLTTAVLLLTTAAFVVVAPGSRDQGVLVVGAVLSGVLLVASAVALVSSVRSSRPRGRPQA